MTRFKTNFPICLINCVFTDENLVRVLVTLPQVERHLLKAADTLRGKLDVSEFKECIFGIRNACILLEAQECKTT